MVKVVRSEDRIRPLRRSEYDRLVATGAFDNEKIELIEGRLVQMSPQGDRHASVITKLNRLLILRLEGLAEVRCQCPIGASDLSEPEPDFAIVPIERKEPGHPRQAHLIIEVAESSLADDRGYKATVYAKMNVPEYWIVNVVENVIEVHTQPIDGSYQKVERTVSPLALLAFPDVHLNPRDFLPL